MTRRVISLVAVLAACNRPGVAAAPITPDEVVGTYRVARISEALVLRKDGTYVRNGREDGQARWTLNQWEGQTRISLYEFEMPLAGGKTRYSTVVERVDGGIVIWLDPDTGLKYERVQER